MVYGSAHVVKELSLKANHNTTPRRVACATGCKRTKLESKSQLNGLRGANEEGCKRTKLESKSQQRQRATRRFCCKRTKLESKSQHFSEVSFRILL